MVDLSENASISEIDKLVNFLRNKNQNLKQQQYDNQRVINGLLQVKSEIGKNKIGNDFDNFSEDRRNNLKTNSNGSLSKGNYKNQQNKNQNSSPHQPKKNGSKQKKLKKIVFLSKNQLKNLSNLRQQFRAKMVENLKTDPEASISEIETNPELNYLSNDQNFLSALIQSLIKGDIDSATFSDLKKPLQKNDYRSNLKAFMINGELAKRANDYMKENKLPFSDLNRFLDRIIQTAYQNFNIQG